MPPAAPRAARSCRPKLPPVPTIKARRDFLAANKGRRAVTPGFILLVHRRGDGDEMVRAGFTVTKKIGGSVTRNRLKRRLRMLAWALLPGSGHAGCDHVLIGRDDGLTRDFAAMQADLAKALARTQMGSS